MFRKQRALWTLVGHAPTTGLKEVNRSPPIFRLRLQGSLNLEKVKRKHVSDEENSLGESLPVKVS